MNTTPFGFAIVDKNGKLKTFLQQDDINECEWRDEFYPQLAPHRIIELYTKEQLDKACEESTEAIRSAARRIGKSTFTANLIAHGIVRSSSDEKGDV